MSKGLFVVLSGRLSNHAFREGLQDFHQGKLAD